VGGIERAIREARRDAQTRASPREPLNSTESTLTEPSAALNTRSMPSRPRSRVRSKTTADPFWEKDAVVSWMVGAAFLALTPERSIIPKVGGSSSTRSMTRPYVGCGRFSGSDYGRCLRVRAREAAPE